MRKTKLVPNWEHQRVSMDYLGNGTPTLLASFKADLAIDMWFFRKSHYGGLPAILVRYGNGALDFMAWVMCDGEWDARNVLTTNDHEAAQLAKQWLDSHPEFTMRERLRQ